MQAAASVWREVYLRAAAVASRRNHKVILKLALISVEEQIHIPIDVRMANAGIVGHIRSPIAGIVP